MLVEVPDLPELLNDPPVEIRWFHHEVDGLEHVVGSNEKEVTFGFSFPHLDVRHRGRRHRFRREVGLQHHHDVPRDYRLPAGELTAHRCGPEEHLAFRHQITEVRIYVSHDHHRTLLVCQRLPPGVHVAQEH